MRTAMESPDNGRKNNGGYDIATYRTEKQEAQPRTAGLLLFAEEVAGDEKDEDTEDAKEGDIAQMED